MEEQKINEINWSTEKDSSASSFHGGSGIYQFRPCAVKKQDGTIYDSPKDCRTAEILALRSRKVLSSLDMEILDVLYKYCILNLEMITLLIQNNKIIGNVMKKDCYERNMKRLRSKGIVLFYISDNGASNCYMLSPSARLYMSHEHGKRYYPNGSGAPDTFLSASVTHVLARNQAYIRILTDYHDLIERKWYRTKFRGQNTVIDGAVTLKLNSSLARRNATVFLLVIRRCSSIRDVSNRLHGYMDCMKSPEFPSPLLLIICEDEAHVQYLSSALLNRRELFPIFPKMFFTADYLTRRKNPLSKLLFCYTEKGGGIVRETVSLSI